MQNRPNEAHKQAFTDRERWHVQATSFEQCQVVVFIADDLGFLGPGSPDLMTELCPPQDTA